MESLVVTSGDRTGITMTDPEERQAPASAPLLARPVVMPDPFGGDEGQQFKDWLANFELCAGLNAWNEDTRRKFLKLSDFGVQPKRSTTCTVWMRTPRRAMSS